MKRKSWQIVLMAAILGLALAGPVRGQTDSGLTKMLVESYDLLEAGKLAEGKFLFEVVMSDADVRFPFDRAELSDEGRRHLDELAQRLKQDDRNVFIEIQGHTDWVGPKEYNEQLGEERAEAVRLYLNREHALPLHRMSVISYGESVPAADNRNRDGRAQNRRVVLVVLS